MQPSGAALAVVGDHPDALLLDARSGREMATLHGHLDYSFAVAWHPSRPLLATGNQARSRPSCTGGTRAVTSAAAVNVSACHLLLSRHTI